MYDELSQLSDAELAIKAGAGCRRSFEVLIDRYSARLLAFISSRVALREDAEDITQDTLIKAYVNMAKYNPRYRFSTWLFSIGYKTAVSHYRRSKTRQLKINHDKETPPPEQQLQVEDEAQNIWKLAKGLSRNQYEALWLRYNEQMQISEIANVMGKSKVHIKVLLHRSRNKLAQMRLEQDQANTSPVLSSKDTGIAMNWEV
ncbi:RNA polymerase sigma factor CnrH [Anaerohalosphaera lusitana]|uniref:RNA polymerase sigma factor n=1 Tax=Anaerohalosphaera lusitana TaxID=1936003 RepID=A0A1U9NL76_9BACT|nr:sigma-70 family RNA polymerase sigma factor [Anaerohalosphaera lusitana]AQT68484.1 RNA polymerase sigma factor CnrH [Anaerohalosphaera lusitana]